MIANNQEEARRVIIGDPSVIAIESKITQAYGRISFRALGLFVLHVGGHRYGVYEPDATMLACSFEAVERRITNRGSHSVAFADEADAAKIADAVHNAVYAEVPYECCFGMPSGELVKSIHSNHIIWAPDGDEAFDDSSHVLQFDIQDRVRVIAFKYGDEGILIPTTLRDVWLAADAFYDILQQWHDAFASQWASAPKEE